MFLSILKKAVPVAKFEKYQKFLFVGPHPDDIEVGAGCTVAGLVQTGKQVSFVVATNGCVGSLDPSLTEERLTAIRQKEALQSAKVLGVEDVTFLPFDDGATYDKDEMTKAIAEIIVAKQPDVILCPDPKTASECHPDHIYVGEIVTKAYFIAQWPKLAQRILGNDKNANPQAVAYYYTDKPNYYFPVRKNFALKMQALACHKSQFSDGDLQTFKTYFKLRNLRFAFRRGKKSEGFRVLSNTHMHCFPEASEF